MAKVLNEQMRAPGQFDSPPVWGGNGAPLHSAMLFDRVRNLNNMQTLREPGFIFFHDMCQPVGVDGVARSGTQYVVAAGGTAGQCLLAQVPVPLPIDANRLIWTAGISRSHFPTEDAIVVNVDNVVLYLTTQPVTYLLEPSPPNVEQSRLFGENYIKGAFTKNVAAATGGDFNIPNPNYTLVTSETWSDFAPRGKGNINDRDRDPWAYLLVTAEFSDGIAGEAIRLAEFSMWGGYY
jgi:hypothetical protein